MGEEGVGVAGSFAWFVVIVYIIVTIDLVITPCYTFT